MSARTKELSEDGPLDPILILKLFISIADLGNKETRVGS